MTCKGRSQNESQTVQEQIQMVETAGQTVSSLHPKNHPVHSLMLKNTESAITKAQIGQCSEIVC